MKHGQHISSVWMEKTCLSRAGTPDIPRLLRWRILRKSALNVVFMQNPRDLSKEKLISNDRIVCFCSPATAAGNFRQIVAVLLSRLLRISACSGRRTA
jgi:hypothetical protein